MYEVGYVNIHRNILLVLTPIGQHFPQLLPQTHASFPVRHWNYKLLLVFKAFDLKMLLCFFTGLPQKTSVLIFLSRYMYIRKGDILLKDELATCR